MRRNELGLAVALATGLGLLSGAGTSAEEPVGRADREVVPAERPFATVERDRPTPSAPQEASVFTPVPAPTSTVTPTRSASASRSTTRRLSRSAAPAIRAATPAEPESEGAAVHSPMPVPEMPVPEEQVLAPDSAVAPFAPAAEEETGPLAPAITGGGFLALEDQNTRIPPDTHGAVGPNQLMVTLNPQVRVQARDGTPLQTVTLQTFWSSLSPAFTFDPRVHYDPFADRWISVACDDPNSPGSALFVGVSQTGDPRSSWFMWRIDADTDDLVWADYPSVGFNEGWVVVQVNMFRISDGGFERTHIYRFDKAPLYAGTLSYDLYQDNAISGTQVPATTYDPGVSDVFLLQRWNSGAGALHLWRLTGPLGSPSLVSVGFPSGPGWSPDAGGVDFAPQLQGPPGCQCAVAPCPPDERIQVNDSRIQNLVYRNGKLWATHTIMLPAGTPTRSSVQWWQLDTSANVLQRGLVDDPTDQRFFAFPSIAVNKNDDVLLGYSSFQDNQYASASYSFRTAIDPLGTMQPEAILRPGDSCYYKDFTQGRNRWGDYSATVVDPTDDVKLWTIQEYAAASVGTGPVDDRWGTWWGMLDPTPQVRMTGVSLAEGDVGTTVFSFQVQLTDVAGNALPTSQTVTVDWRTGDGTATVADMDYVGVGSAVLTFLPGETLRTIDVTVNGDLKREGDETFVVDLFGSTNATIVNPQATGTILNDDPVPQMSIGDVTMLEGDGGDGATSFVFRVTLSNPSDSNVQASWGTMDGTAIAGPFGTGDYVGASGVVAFPAGSVVQTVTVQVHGDLAPEPDELFYVDLLSPLGATLLKTRGVGQIQDDDAVNPGVIGFGIVADGDAASGRNRLQWLNPSGVTPSRVLIEYNEGPTCAAPAATVGAGTGSIALTPVLVGSTQSYPHTGLVLDREYCYTIFLEYVPGPIYSAGASMSARPFDATGKIKWKLSTGMTGMAPPTVGLDAVIGLSNNMYVQAMQRGAGGGVWPGPWKPIHLGDVGQHRAPVVPIGGVSRAFIATQDGRVHAIDTANGNLLWSTQLAPAAALGAPAGIFTAFGGAWDYVLVGTSAGDNNRIYALDPFTGAVLDAFDNGGGIGAILGTGAVDYAAKRVYFGSKRGSNGGTVWCLDLGPPSNALSLGWVSTSPGDVNGSPVLRGSKVYVGALPDAVWAIPAATGTGEYMRSLGDGEPDGFLFPDRRNANLYVATNTHVWGLVDNGSGFPNMWTEIALTDPSIVLLAPGTNDLYVGVRDDGLGNAAVVRIDVLTGSPASSVALESQPFGVGAPSLDNVFEIIHVGSEAGILYAVELPF